MEQWKKVDRWYSVSTFGNVMGPKGITKPYLAKAGYLQTSISQKTKLLHRLVAIAFIPNPNNLPEVNHINGIKTDNRIENLEWSTRRGNTLHSLRTGLYHVKLDSLAVEIIREAYATGRWYQREIAAYFKVHPAYVCDIINHKSRIIKWTH